MILSKTSRLKAIAVLLVFATWACSTATQQTITNGGSQAVLFDKPIPDFELPTEDFLLPVATEEEIVTFSGTRIVVPDSAFEKEDGTIVTDSVQLSYREARTPAEIILSGITMEYTANGETNTFQTAGMFELRAFANGEALRLRQGKTVAVEMKSEMPGEFNFYNLEETDDKGWVEVGKADAKKVEDEITLEEAEAKIVELKKVKAPKQFNSAEDHLVDIDLDYTHISELKSNGNLLWKFANNPTAEENAVLKKYKWQEVDLNPVATADGNYELTLTRGEKVQKLMVAPLLVSKDLKKAKAAYNKVQAEIKNMEALIASKQTAADVFSRSYNVSSLGWKNWDSIYKNPLMVWLNSAFETPDATPISMTGLKAFLVTEKGSVVMRYSENNLTKLSYDPTKKTTLLVFAADGSISAVPSSDFEKLTYQPSSKTLSHSFAVGLLNKKQADIKSVDDLEQLMAKL